jgi:hypothetical protein
MKLRGISVLGAAVALLAGTVGAASAAATSGAPATARPQAHGPAVGITPAPGPLAEAGIRPAGSGGVVFNANWAGYVVRGSSYEAAGYWVQPTIKCTAGLAKANADASFWVGLDGWGNPTVEQEGADSFCYLWKGHYYTGYQAWTEMFPRRTAWINKPVYGGDHMYGLTYYSKITRKYTLEVRDLTQHWTYITHTAWSSTDRNASAEAIGEVLGNGTTPLPRFSPVTFTHVTTNGHPLYREHYLTVIAAARRTVKEQPGKVYPNSSFALYWRHY